MIRNHDAHLRANLAPVIGQFGRPEKIKPDKSSFNDDIMIMLLALNADDACRSSYPWASRESET